MSEKKQNTVHEPLFHLAKRAHLQPWKAWAIRLAAIVLGLVVCGLVAFILIEKLNQNPDRIDDFYYSFIKGLAASVTLLMLVTIFDTSCILLNNPF